MENNEKWTKFDNEQNSKKGTKLHIMDKNKYVIFNFFHLLCFFSVNKTIFDGFEAL